MSDCLAVNPGDVATALDAFLPWAFALGILGAQFVSVLSWLAHALLDRLADPRGACGE